MESKSNIKENLESESKLDFIESKQELNILAKSDDAFVEAFLKFFDSDFADKIEKFLEDNCHSFDPEEIQETHELEHYELFQRYERTFEKRIRKFCDQERISEHDFYIKLKKSHRTHKQESSEEEDNGFAFLFSATENPCRFLLELILISTDYSMFAQIMKQKKTELEYKKSIDERPKTIDRNSETKMN